MKITKQQAYVLIFWVLMGCLTVILYWPGLHGPFILDDLQTLLPAKMNHFSFRNFIEICLSNDTGPLGRPLSISTFALNYLFFGDKAFYFKAVNLALHLIIGLSVALFIYLLVMLQPKSKKNALFISLLTALIWLIHPIQISTVLYAVQRMTQLSHLFILMGLITYLIGRIRLKTQQEHAYPWILCSLFIFLPLSVFSKETGVLFIWYLWCTEYFMLSSDRNTLAEKRILDCVSMLSLFLILTSLCYYWYKLPTFLAIFAEKNLTVFERLLTETKVVLLYARLVLLPKLSQLGFYHDDILVSHHIDSDVFWGSIFIASCIALIFFLRKRMPVVAFGLAWFLISQVIESTILPLELAFEHRNYLASVGLVFIPCYYFIMFCYKATYPIKIACAVLISLLIATLMSMTFIRSVSWSTPERFLVDALYYHPQSPRAHIEMANWYLSKGAYARAFVELDNATALEPYNAGLALHRILIFCRAKAVPPFLYDLAQNKVRQGAITPYVIVVLDQLIKNMFNEQCASVDAHKITAIIDQALQNPYLWYKPRYTAILYHLESGLALIDHNLNQSLSLLDKSFDTYPKRLDPLIQKAYLELQHGMINDAQVTVKKVNAHTSYLHAGTDEINDLNKALASKIGSDK